MRRNGLWVVAALLLGIGAGYVAGSQTVATEGGPETTLEGDRKDAGDGAEPGLLSASRPATAQAGADPDEGPVLRGTGVIQGTVKDKNGQPVAGVVVIARPYLLPSVARRRPGNAPPRLRSEEETVAEAARQARRGYLATARGTSDASGRYRIEGLGATRFWLQPFAGGYQIRQVQRGSPYGGVKPPATIDFTATAIVPVHVRVLGLDGQRVEEATVRANRSPKPQRGGGTRMSAEHDWLDLEPGSYWLSAVAGEDQELGSDVVPLTIEPGGAPGTVTIQLRGRPGLIGTVVYGDALADVRGNVWAKRFDTPEPPAADDIRRDREAVRGRMDRDGAGFRFEDLAPGRYLVVLELNRRLPTTTAVVEIRDRRETVEIEVPPLDRAEFVPVLVTGADGKPVLDARMDVSFKGPNLSMSGGGTSIRLRDGSYLASRRPAVPRGRRMPKGREMPVPDFTGGTFRMRIWSPTAGKRDIPIDPDAREIRVALGEPVDVRIRFHGAAQSMIPPDARAHLVESVPENHISGAGDGQSVVDVGGALFERVQPGARRLVLQVMGPQNVGLRQILVVPFTVEPGKVEYDVVLPDFNTLRVSGVAKSATLTCIDPGGNWVHQFVRETQDGVATFVHVPPGTYEVSVYQGRGKKPLTMKVQMGAADQSVAFK